METNQTNGKTDQNEEKDNQFKVTGDWNAQSKLIKANYASLTDNDLKFEPGKENELLTRMESRLGKKRPEVISIIRKYQPMPSNQ